jgi:hypothetical protein
MNSTETALLESLQRKKITGHDLAAMVERGELTKQQRRRLSKKFNSICKKSLSARQKLRLEVKEKKQQPKKTREEQIQKYRKDIELEREQSRALNSVCLGCRKRGHVLKFCPDVVRSAKITDTAAITCFNCGSSEHALRNCPKDRDPSGKLNFAKCFVCNGVGHISKDCPENANGVYPKGGCCHICLQKTHLARDCPERTEEDKERVHKLRQEQEDAELGPRIGAIDKTGGGGDDLDFDISGIEDGTMDEGDGDDAVEPTSRKKRSLNDKDKKKKKKSKN